MPFMPRFLILAALAATAIPFASATSCASNEFSWNGLKGNCCLPHGGNPSPPSPPQGKSCPSNNWYWHSGQECCVPKTPTPPAPSCPSGSTWESQCCKRGTSSTPPPTQPTSTPKPPTSTCPPNNFPWSGLKGDCCIPHGGNPKPPTPPPGKSCPSNGWYWHSDQGCCVPSNPSPPTPSCPSGSTWGNQCCNHPSSPTSSKPATTPAPTSPAPTGKCNPSEFKWSGLLGDCCVPNGGNPKPPSPPPGKSCPGDQGWWWHSGQGCCVPSHPSPPPPKCPSGAWWGSQCCNHNPQPSGKPHWKRNAKKRSAGLCPTSLEACPVNGASGLTSDYECIDTTHDLESCGGCASLHPELDCTAIEGAWNVGCDNGACKVYSCQAGYKLSHDATSCDKL